MTRTACTIGLAALLLAATACGGGDSGGGSDVPGSEAPATGVPGTDTPLPSLAATLSDSNTLPDSFEALAVATSGDRQVVVGRTPRRVAEPTYSYPLAAWRMLGEEWNVVTIDDGSGYAPPATASENRFGFSVEEVVAGPNGFVAIGWAAFHPGNYALGSGALIWQSPDGVTWTRIDARGAIANLAPSGVQYRQLSSTPSGYVLAGNTGLRTFVLRSADGINWTQTLDLTKAWALLPHDIAVDGETVLLWADEFYCQAEAFAALTQPVLRLSSDGGVTWSEVDPAMIPTIENVVPEPDAATCGPTDYTSFEERFEARFGHIGLAGGTLVVTNEAADEVAVSSDHTTWTVVDLPPPYPEPDVPYFLESQYPRSVVAVGDLLVVLSGSGPTVQDQPRQLVGWVSEDGGASWAAIAGTDLLVPPGRFRLTQRADGSALDLLFQPMDSQGNDPNGTATVATITLG